MDRKWLRGILVLVLAVGGYFGWNAYQTQLGRAALAATQLEFKPLDAALAEARSNGRPVLAEFSAIWCPSCRALHQTVFTDAAVKAAIGAGYVLARIDYESPEAPAFMQRYDVHGFPSLLVLDADGRLLRRLPVTLDAAAFAAALKPAPG